MSHVNETKHGYIYIYIYIYIYRQQMDKVTFLLSQGGNWWQFNLRTLLQLSRISKSSFAALWVKTGLKIWLLFCAKDIPLDYVMAIAWKNPRQMLLVDFVNAELD